VPERRASNPNRARPRRSNRDSKKIEDDKQQPGGHDVSENSRLKKDANAGDDLITPTITLLMAVTTDEIVCDRGQVFIPVDEQVEEFIQARQNRRNGEAEAENLKRCLRNDFLSC